MTEKSKAVNKYRIVIQTTVTTDLVFNVQANTREEARGRAWYDLTQGGGSIHRQSKSERFVSLKVVGAAEIPPNK